MAEESNCKKCGKIIYIPKYASSSGFCPKCLFKNVEEELLKGNI